MIASCAGRDVDRRVTSRRNRRAVFVGAMISCVLITALVHPASGAPAQREQIGSAQAAGAEIDAAWAKVKAWARERSAEMGVQAEAIWDHSQLAAKDAQRALMGDPLATPKHRVLVASSRTLAPNREPVRSVDSAVAWRDLNDQSLSLPTRVVVLLHGLDEPGNMWDDLAPALLDKGYTIVKLEYPNDGAISASGEIFAGVLADLRARGVTRADIVAHSMGGLVAREALTRPGLLAGPDARHRAPQVGRLIMLSTPNQGSVLAPLQPLSEAREHLLRRLDHTESPEDGLVNSYADGDGAAARDLLPNSDFLRALNARPLPQGVEITNIVASVVTDKSREELVACTRWAERELSASLGVEADPLLVGRFASWVDRAIGSLGDGLVSAESAALPGVTDTVRLEANHRGMVQRSQLLEALGLGQPGAVPPAIPVILDRLSREPG